MDLLPAVGLTTLTYTFSFSQRLLVKKGLISALLRLLSLQIFLEVNSLDFFYHKT